MIPRALPVADAADILAMAHKTFREHRRRTSARIPGAGEPGPSSP